MTMMEPLSLDQARHQANVQAKAERLYDLGYGACWLTEDVLEVASPRGETYRLDLFAGTCDCPGFSEAGFCSHIWGWPKLTAALEKEGACSIPR